MTQLDVLYRYGAQPSEAAAMAIANLREVYGIRKTELREMDHTIRVEYDATRLTEPVIHQLLRRAGLDILEALPMFPPPPPPPEASATA